MVDPSQTQVVITGGSGPGEIGELNVRFVVPEAGAFGRDRNVAMADASAARVSYVRDGRLVEDQSVTVGEAVTLIDQATRDATAAAARSEANRQVRTAEAAQSARQPADLACMVCGARTFDERTSQEDIAWGAPTVRMRLLICQHCGFVMQFALTQTISGPR